MYVRQCPQNDARRFWCISTGLTAGHERARSGFFSKNVKNVKDFRAMSHWVGAQSESTLLLQPRRTKKPTEKILSARPLM